MDTTAYVNTETFLLHVSLKIADFLGFEALSSQQCEAALLINQEKAACNH